MRNKKMITAKELHKKADAAAQEYEAARKFLLGF